MQDEGARVIAAVFVDEMENNDNRVCIAVLVIVRYLMRFQHNLSLDM